MKVFVCWSGPLGEKLGEAIRNWLPNVVQSVKPYFTPADVDKGSRWLPDIAEELNESKVGIICVTRENLQSDWIHFEAGALSKTVGQSHVCPVLFGVKNTDLTGPLKQFQATKFEQKDFRKLVNVINECLDEGKLATKTLETVFGKFWPDLKSTVEEILGSNPEPDVPIRTERDILEEVLALTRSSARRSSRPGIPNAALTELLEGFVNLHDDQARHVGGYQHTLDLLKEMRKPVAYLIRRQPEFVGDAYRDLVERFSELSYQELPKEGVEEDGREDDDPC